MSESQAEVIESQVDENQDLTVLDDADLHALVEGDGEVQETVDQPQDQPEEGASVEKDGQPATEPAKPEQAEEDTADTDWQSKARELEQRLDKQTKRNEDQAQFIERRNNELGRLRQMEQRLHQLKEQKQKLDHVPPEQYIENPGAYHAYREQVNSELNQLSGEQQQAVRDQRLNQNRTFAQQFMPDFESKIQDIVETVKDDGIFPEQALLEFQRNPYAEDPVLLYGLYNRASARTVITEKDKQIADLQAQVQQLKAKPGETLRRVQQAARSKPLSNASGGAQPGGSQPEYTEADLPNLTDKELAALLKH